MYLQLLIYKAWAAVLEGQWVTARTLLDQAQPVAQSGAGSPTLRGRIEQLQAEIERGNGRLPAAREHIEKALELMSYRTDQPEPALPQGLTMAARIALEQGRASDAQQLSSDALQLSERMARGANTSADVGEALLLQARARAASARPAELRMLLERAVQCLDNGFGNEHPVTREARAMLGRIGN
jgi:hypothetical protein